MWTPRRQRICLKPTTAMCTTSCTTRSSRPKPICANEFTKPTARSWTVRCGCSTRSCACCRSWSPAVGRFTHWAASSPSCSTTATASSYGARASATSCCGTKPSGIMLRRSCTGCSPSWSRG
uniref:(northern house mosquito) hypothetical protein n=1 Tax=Culex pipiens TaxID=7175 RepID=A0A8D8AMU0_CULPI